MKKVIISGYEFIFDDDIDTFPLCASKLATGYVLLTYSSGPHRGKVFARHLMNVTDSNTVDHINGNPLDNRRENLRVCTHQQNCFNRGGHSNKKSGLPKGVFKTKLANWYCAKIMLHGKSIHLGQFYGIEAAKEAYEKKAQELFGEFAKL